MTNDETIFELSRLVRADKFEEAWRVRQQLVDEGLEKLTDNQIDALVDIRYRSKEFDAVCTKLDKMVRRLTS